MLELLQHATVNAIVHITGGGFYENIPRVFNDPNHAALIDIYAWHWPEIFSWLQQAGNIEQTEMLTTFNCGIGFLLIVPEDQADQAIQSLAGAGEAPVRLGRIVNADDTIPTGQILIKG